MLQGFGPFNFVVDEIIVDVTRFQAFYFVLDQGVIDATGF